MSNSGSKSVNANSKSTAAMVTIETTNLKDRLNAAYLRLHGGLAKRADGVTYDGNFDRLWDLKESAILEGKKTVELPGQWLNELDDMVPTSRPRH